MNRKQFIKGAGAGAAAIGGMVGCGGQAVGQASDTSSATVERGEGSTRRALHLPNGRTRFEKELMIWGAIPLQIKVSTNDTAGALFVFEHANMGKGGQSSSLPPTA